MPHLAQPADLLCPHGSLSIAPKVATPVIPAAWQYFKTTYPEAREWNHKSETCPVCEQLENDEKEQMGDRKLSRLEEKNKNGYLATCMKGCRRFDDLEVGEYTIVSARWVNKWRQYLETVQIDHCEPITWADLKCQHGLLNCSLASQLISRQQGEPSLFYLIDGKEWVSLKKYQVCGFVFLCLFNITLIQS
jgi:hypothetical protein